MPMDVLKDPNLSSSAKLLYTLIQSYSAKTGVCWASNERLAKGIGLNHPDSVTRLLRELKKERYIDIERGKNSKKIMLLAIEKEHSPDSEGLVTEMAPDQNVGSAPDQNVGLVSKNKKVNSISKDIGEDPVSYGREDINLVLATLQAVVNMPLDGSVKENRKYAHLLIQKHKNVEGIITVIKLAASHKYFSTKLASAQKLYYSFAEIVQALKAEERKVNTPIEEFT